MFLPYKIKTETIKSLTHNKPLNRQFLAEQEEINDIIRSNVDIERIKQELIDGTRLQEEWFPVNHPKMKFDVFISHSHKDITEIILPLAYWLHNELGLSCFIDSSFWLYADDLLKYIDKWYAYDKSSKTYDYSIRNYTTSHVHNMLSMALMKMMAKTECVIFVDSDNSINYVKGNATTPSPWIYEEICFANNLEIKIPQRYVNKLMPLYESGGVIQQRTFCSKGEKPELKVQYKVNLDDFYEISEIILNTNHNLGNRNDAALDYLHQKALAQYEIKDTRRKIFS